MLRKILPLIMVAPNKEVILVSIEGEREGERGLRTRLTDMGLNEGVRLKVLHSQNRGSCIILIDHIRLVLGWSVAKKILVEITEENKKKINK